MFKEIGSFEVSHAERAWPWIAFSAQNDRLGFVGPSQRIETRRIEGSSLLTGPAFAVPSDIALEAFSISATEVVVAGGGVLAVLGRGGESKRVSIEPIHALAFDRTGKRIWISRESADKTIVELRDAETLALIGTSESAALPRPSLHTLHLHAQDDAVLLVAACGEAGTFARVVGFAGDEVSRVDTELDAGAVAADFIGFSTDGRRVHLVEADELRTHAWPTLHELSSVPLADDFISSFGGAVLGDEILVDGEDADSQEDAVMLFDIAGIHGTILPGDAPAGMWAGRLGPKHIVTVEPKGDPAQARVLERLGSAPKRMMS